MKKGDKYSDQELLAFISEHEESLLNKDYTCSEVEVRILTTSLALCAAELVKRLYEKERP